MGRENEPEDAPRRILRVNLPVRYHIQLHELRIVTGKNITALVQEALDMYFAALSRGPLGPSQHHR